MKSFAAILLLFIASDVGRHSAEAARLHSFALRIGDSAGTVETGALDGWYGSFRTGGDPTVISSRMEVKQVGNILKVHWWYRYFNGAVVEVHTITGNKISGPPGVDGLLESNGDITWANGYTSRKEPTDKSTDNEQESDVVATPTQAQTEVETVKTTQKPSDKPVGTTQAQKKVETVGTTQAAGGTASCAAYQRVSASAECSTRTGNYYLDADGAYKPAEEAVDSTACCWAVSYRGNSAVDAEVCHFDAKGGPPVYRCAEATDDEQESNVDDAEPVGTTQARTTVETVGTTQAQQIVGTTQAPQIVGTTQAKQIVETTQAQQIVETTQPAATDPSTDKPVQEHGTEKPAPTEKSPETPENTEKPAGPTEKPAQKSGVAPSAISLTVFGSAVLLLLLSTI